MKKLRWLAAGAAIGLLVITLVLGTRQFGAKNWLRLGPLSLQPSEIAKICYIFAGAATLDRLFRKRNLWLFIVLTGACLGCLALMSDFGTAAIFFVTFLVIAYLRSGDWATLALITGGAVFGADSRAAGRKHSDSRRSPENCRHAAHERDPAAPQCARSHRDKGKPREIGRGGPAACIQRA